VKKTILKRVAVLCLVAAAALRAQSAPHSFMTVPRVAGGAVALDGVVDKREWFEAQQASFLHSVVEWGQINRRVRVWLQHDGEALYVGFEVERPKSSGGPVVVLNAENRHLGEGAYGLFGDEDRIGVVVRSLAGKALRVTGNAGSIAIARFDGGAAEGVEYRSRTERSYWEGECRIPLALVGGGDEFDFDFLNLQATPEKKTEALAWRREVQHDAGLWRVKLTSAGVTARVRTELFGHTFPNAVWLDCWNGGDKPAPVTVTYTVTDLAALGEFEGIVDAAGRLAALTPESRTSVVPAQSKLRECLRVPAELGRHALQYRVEAGPTLCAQGVVFVNNEPPLDLKLRYYFLQHKKIECLVSAREARDLGKGAAVEFVLGDAAGAVYDRKRAPLSADEAEASVYLDSSQLAEGGGYFVRAALTDDGKTLAEKKVAFVRPQTPEWWNSGLGLTEKVAPGYGPLEKTARGFKLALREYTFDDVILPRMIAARGDELLAGPVVLKAEAGGGEVALAPGPLTVADVRAVGARLAQTWTGGGLKVEIAATLDYDGFLKYDVDVAGAGVEIEKLALEAPVKAQYAQWFCHQQEGTAVGQGRHPFLHPSRFPYGELDGYFRLHPSGWMPFTWGFYLGCEDRGLEWVAESDKAWSPQDEKEMIGLVRDADRVTLMVRFVDKPVTLAAPRRFSFGLMAVPVREIRHNDYFQLTRTGGHSLGPRTPPAPAQDPAIVELYRFRKQQGFKILSHYTNFGKPLFSNVRFYDEKLLGQVRAVHGLCKERGIIGIHYCGYSLPPGIPDNETFGAEMRMEPAFRPGWYKHAGPFTDYWLHGAKFMVENANVQSFHTDGLCGVPLTTNRLDGYGWERGGKLHGSYPVFAARELYKRFYHMLKFEIEGGVAAYHTPHAGRPPVFAVQSFSDAAVGGEDLYHISKLDDLSLVQYRMNYCTTTLGVMRVGIWHYKAIPVTKNMMLTLHNLHGVLYHYINLRYSNHPYELMGGFLPELEMWQRLGRDKVRFLPYWRHPNLAAARSDIDGFELPAGRIKVSAYVREDRDQALLVVANLDQVGYTLKLKPNAAALGLRGPRLVCTDPVLGQYYYPRAGEEIRLDFYPQRWRAVLIRGQAK